MGMGINPPARNNLAVKMASRVLHCSCFTARMLIASLCCYVLFTICL